MMVTARSHPLGIFIGALVFAAGPGCSALRPKSEPPPVLHSLDSNGVPSAADPGPRIDSAAAPTLLVEIPRADAGYDSRRMIYVRTAHRPEYFALNEWVDTPARMLAPLIVSALAQGGAFRAIVPAAAAAHGDLRIDTEIVRLQQDFTRRPSSVRFTLRVHVIDEATRHVVTSGDFDTTVDSASDDPAGGTVAANQAVQTLLGQMARFCAQTAADWKRTKPAAPP